MQFPVIILAFIISSAYVLLLNHLAFSSRSLQHAFVIILITVFVISFRYYRQEGKALNSKEAKFFFIFGGTVLTQLLVLSTGGLSSPFFILMHLFMIGLSFLFSFSLGLLFLLSSLTIIFVNLSSTQDVLSLLQDDPTLILLQLASLLVIIPLAYLVSRQYHMKDTLASMLRTRIKTTEAILESIPELVIITDPLLHILSVNDAVTKTLQRSQSELLDQPLFDVLLLKDSQGKLVTAKPKNTTDTFTLVTSSNLPKQVTLHTQSVKQGESNVSQLSFIISFAHTGAQAADTLDKARTRYEALVQNIKKQLSGTTLRTAMLLLEKVEQDTYAFLQLGEQSIPTLARVDIAQLCKQTVEYNQVFAESFHITTNFALSNFGQKEIAPLTVKSYPVNPEQLTGPFFTASCDVTHVELIIKKLFDMTLFLSSSQKDSRAAIRLEQTAKVITITLSGTAPMLSEKELPLLMTPYYGKLSETTNLHLGSGLEGILVKQLTDRLGIPLSMNYNKQTSEMSFSLAIAKAKKGN